MTWATSIAVPAGQHRIIRRRRPFGSDAADHAIGCGFFKATAAPQRESGPACCRPIVRLGRSAGFIFILQSVRDGWIAVLAWIGCGLMKAKKKRRGTANSKAGAKEGAVPLGA